MKVKAHQRRRNWLVRGLALGLAAAAVAAPAGQAKHDVGGATGEAGSEYVPFVSDFPKSAEATRPTVIPYLSQGQGILPERPVAVVSTPVDDGYEWQPFAIGTGAGLTLALLAALSLAGLRRHRGMALS